MTSNLATKLREGTKEGLSSQDHRDLGVAYMGMGLVDDAVREFNAAGKKANPKITAPMKGGVKKKAAPAPKMRAAAKKKKPAPVAKKAVKTKPQAKKKPSAKKKAKR